jgi:acyl-CoA synthetase (AMP-forming)/AMP-acid ligase II
MTNELDAAREFVLGQMLIRKARMNPDQEAVILGDRRCTFQELNDRVNRLANGLMSLGIQPRDKVAVLFENCMEMIESIFAIAKLGCVVVPINYRLIPREMAYQIDNSDSIALLFDRQYDGHIASVHHELTKVRHWVSTGETGKVTSLSYEGMIKEYPATQPLVLIRDEEPLFILYTSGTTGRPKGAVLTHKSTMLQTLNLATDIPAPNPRISLLVYPLFHSGGIMSFLWDLFIGTVVVMNKITVEEILRLIQEEKVTATSMVPDLWNRIVNHPDLTKYDLSSLRVACTGAAPTPRILKEKVSRVFPNIGGMWEAFGMTETCATGVMGTPEDNFKKAEAMGRTISNWEMRVVDDQDREVPRGVVGEVVYRGPGVLKEYYKSPEATAEAFKNGWFHSGDLAWVDGDGYFYFAGRKKDMIISGGENIYPAEVEEILYKHPKVLEAAVIGVPDPDWGESVMAIIVLKPGEKMAREEVIEYSRQNLASYKKPRQVEFVNELPKSSTNKVLKYVLRERYAQGSKG